MRRHYLFFCCILLSACSTVQPYYDKSLSDWEQAQMPSSDSLRHTVFLIGDAGAPQANPLEPTLQLLQQQLDSASKKSTVVFLGDNIYPEGMPKKKDDSRADAEQKLTTQLSILDNFKGRITFIPGNHDWQKGKKDGLEYIKRQERFVEKYLDDKDVFLPANGCPGPEVVKLGKHAVMLVIDTQWWLHRHEKSKGDVEGCDLVYDELQFIVQVKEALKSNKNKKILVVGHHPLMSNGSHNGYYPLKSHLFPLTAKKKNLYVPLPVVGSIFPFYRKFLGNIQDIPHPRYQALITALTEEFSNYDNIIYAAGHEHNLQYEQQGNLHHIISGSGSKTTWAAKGHGTDYVHEAKGFAKLNYYKNGTVWLEFWVPDENGGKVTFRKKVDDKDRPFILEEDDAHEHDFGDSTVTGVLGQIYHAGKLKNTILGEHYRKEWLEPTQFEVLNLHHEHGGLTPLKKGGGMQTKSLRFEGGDGHQYVIRSIQKYPISVIPKALRKTFAVSLVQDQISASYPYASLVVPTLADAGGVYHTNPRLVYVPHDPILGRFKDEFGGLLALYEERPHGDQSDQPSFGNTKEIIGTPDLLNRMHIDHDHEVDERAMLRARLLDVFIGDWDRHEDQWRWAAFKTKHGKKYRPIPRDRDQVFHRFDGLVPSLANRKWGLRKFQNFNYNIRDIKGLCFNARYVDRTFLTDLSLNDWMQVVDTFQAGLTDEVITEAFTHLPKNIYDISGDELVAKLKYRRDHLKETAKEYYLVLAKEVEVVGSEKEEFFKVERKKEGKTEVTVYQRGKGSNKKHKVYHRVFKDSETKEIRLYGLGGNDWFDITGEVKKGIMIRIIGGEGKDKIMDNSSVSGMKRHTRVYDTKKENELYLGKESKDFTSDKDPHINTYNRKAFAYDIIAPKLYMGFNKDDGIFIGGGAGWTHYGFRREPYASQQSIVANYAVATSAYNFKYEGDFTRVVGNLDFNLVAERWAPRFLSNYFGIGNETPNEVDDLDYYRMRFKYLSIYPALKKDNRENSKFYIGPHYTSMQVLGTSNSEHFALDSTLQRFILTEEANLTLADFEDKTYVGLKSMYELENFDDPNLPTRGYSLLLEGSYNANTDGSKSYLNLKSEFGITFTVKLPFPVTIASRVGGATNIGEYEFFQSNFIGGIKEMRGLRRNRFAGQSSFYQNNDVRIKLFNINSYIIPMRVGLLGFYDIGRVWEEDDRSDVMHNSYGGGLWFSPLNKFALVAGYAISDDDELLNVTFGFMF